MSASTKQKHVFLETINNLTLPADNQQIVKVKGPRGNNLHDVEAPNGEVFIVTMPVKFRKSVWTKRGDFLIIESIEEGNKVKGEIIHILSKDHIRYIKSQGLWPAEFASVDDDEKISKNDDMFPASDEEAYESGDEDQEKYLNEFEQKNLNK